MRSLKVGCPEEIALRFGWFVAHSRDGIRLEFPTDAHWNAIAHEVVAEALASSRLYRTMFALP